MSSFTLKCHKAGRSYSSPHFFILSRGLNCGKPLKEPCPNCFVIIPKRKKDGNCFYWIAYSLWKTKAFHPYFVGSVIPFVRKGDFRSLIQNAFLSVSADPAALSKSIALLMDIDQKRKHFEAVSHHIDILHEAILMRLLNPKKKPH